MRNNRSQSLGILSCGTCLGTLGRIFVLLLGLAGFAAAQTLTTLHDFTGNGDGRYPEGVILGPKQSLFGITYEGGAFNFGVAFKLDSHGHESVLHNFAVLDGFWPEAPMTLAADGTLYGTTREGGTRKGGQCNHGCGTVFKIDTSGKQTVLHGFTGGSDGGNPVSRLIIDSQDNFYGTAAGGGDSNGDGVVFKIDPSGKETVLHTFSGSDGSLPFSGVVRDGSGSLYGATFGGGLHNRGTIYKIDQNGTFTSLYDFTGGSDSAYPRIYVLDRSGNVYGNTQGVTDYGNVFKFTPTGKLIVLYKFKNATDGEWPSYVVRDSSGILYGATASGGGHRCGELIDGCGTVYKLDPKGHKTLLHAFDGTDGGMPDGLTLDSAGHLYGATSVGGMGNCNDGYAPGCGTLFELTP